MASKVNLNGFRISKRPSEDGGQRVDIYSNSRLPMHSHVVIITGPDGVSRLVYDRTLEGEVLFNDPSNRGVNIYEVTFGGTVEL